MENWLTYIEDTLSNVAFDDIETTQTHFYLYRTYFKDGTYISFDLIDNQRTIRKVEVGKYWKTENDAQGYEYSSIKAVFDKSRSHLIDFLQLSFDKEYGKKYELEFSKNGKNLLSRFLSIPLVVGWNETYHKFKGDYYKTTIDLKVNEDKLNFEIGLLHFTEQDLPMPGDRTGRLIYKWWADLSVNSNHRDVEKEVVRPLIEQQ